MKKIIPNSITCCNLISGCIATTYAFIGDPRMALLWIIIGAVFDFFDGMSARLLKVSSPIGKELDSLADDVTFGVAPSTMIFWQLGVLDDYSFLEPVHAFVPYFAFIMAAFSALRLAKFNLDTRQTTSFIGLPTPANALFWGSLIVFCPSWLVNSSASPLIIIAMVCVSSYLLISEIPMFALKFKQWGWKGNEVKYVFVALAVASFIGFTIFEGIIGCLEAWWFIIALYLIISIGLFVKK
nr:CDP-diacylglycerol--serine O-phosphatidyltransferase [Prevotella sp.]